MSRINLDSSASKQLQDLMEPVEVCDVSGRLIGRFVPLIDMSEWEPISPDVSEEELDRRSNSQEKCYTTQEVLDYLKKL